MLVECKTIYVWIYGCKIVFLAIDYVWVVYTKISFGCVITVNKNKLYDMKLKINFARRES